ncbi:hypothetical protein [Nocardioides sp. P5_E3]
MTSPPTPNDIADALRDTAAEVGLRIWQDLPGDFWHGTVSWPDDEDPAGFVREAAALGAKLLYLASAGEGPEAVSHVGAAFAHQGVIYRFAHGSRHEVPEADTVVVDESWEDDDSDAELTDDSLDFVPFLKRHDDGPEGETWPEALRRIMGSKRRADRLGPVVDAIVEDPNFAAGNYFERTQVRQSHDAGLPSRDTQLIRKAVDHRWEVFTEPELKAEAAPIAARLLESEDLDPFVSGRHQVRETVRAAIPELDPRLVPYVADALEPGLDELRHRFNSTVKRLSQAIYDSLDPATKDRMGFARGARLQAAVIADVIEDVPDRMRERVVDKVTGYEQEHNLVSRERRFATLGRALLNRGMTKTAAGRALGISPAVLDRLLTTHRDDVTIDDDDYLSDLLRP